MSGGSELRQRSHVFTRRAALRAGAALSAGTAFLAACGSDSKETAKSTTAPSSGGPAASNATAAAGTAVAKEQPRKGGKFGWYASTVNNFNIVTNWHDGQNIAGIHVYDRLLSSRTDERRYVLEAAASVEQPEPTRVIFKLKPGLKYHNLPPVNGREVRADDIVATQTYVRDLTTAVNSAFQRDVMQRVESPDPNTVVFHLKQPNAYLFAAAFFGNNTSQSIIPKEMLDNLDQNKPVGSGPYQLADVQLNTRYSFKRFDGWREAAQGKPYIDEREVTVITDPVAQEAAFRSEQLSAWQLPVSNVDRIEREMGAKLVMEKAAGLGVFAWHLNLTRDPWKDPRVREALYRLTNRTQFINLNFARKAAAPTGAIPTGLKAYQLDAKESEATFKNDVQAARQLLTAAGYDTNKEYEVICSGTNAVNQQAAEVWQQQVAQAGIKVRVLTLPFAEWLPNRIAKANFDIILGSSPGEDTPARAIRLHHSDQRDQFSNMGLRDARMDALIEKSEQEIKPDENIKQVKAIQLELLKVYTPNYMIVTQDYYLARNAKLMDYEVIATTNPLFRTEAWFKA